MNEVYYLDQDGWDQDSYYALWRYLNRFFLHSPRNMEKIKEIDLSACSEVTKVLMYCLIKHQRKEGLFELENLKDLVNVQPLKEPLKIITPPTNSVKIFTEYNIVF